MFRRNRFADTISRQLDLFAADEAHGLLADVRSSTSGTARADRDEAEEAYGDYSDAVDAVIDALAEMRDRFAATLEEPLAEQYERAFEDAARKRWRWINRDGAAALVRADEARLHEQRPVHPHAGTARCHRDRSRTTGSFLHTVDQPTKRDPAAGCAVSVTTDWYGEPVRDRSSRTTRRSASS